MLKQVVGGLAFVLLGGLLIRKDSKDSVAVVYGGSLARDAGEQRKTHIHAGIDIAAPLGTSVHAPVDGVILDLSPDGKRDAYGNTVLLGHRDGTASLYAHLQGFNSALKIGSHVKAGDVLGYVGNTHAPDTDQMGAHLHLEVHQWVNSGYVVNRATPKRLKPLEWLALQNKVAAA